MQPCCLSITICQDKRVTYIRPLAMYPRVKTYPARQPTKSTMVHFRRHSLYAGREYFKSCLWNIRQLSFNFNDLLQQGNIFCQLVDSISNHLGNVLAEAGIHIHAWSFHYRRPVGDPGHPQSPGHPARHVQAAAEYTKQASKFPNATWTMFLNSPSMTISSIGTLNIPGTNIFRRKLWEFEESAKLNWGVKDRSAWMPLKIAFVTGKSTKKWADLLISRIMIGNAPHILWPESSWHTRSFLTNSHREQGEVGFSCFFLPFLMS